MTKLKFLLSLPLLLIIFFMFLILGLFKIYIFKLDTSRIGHFLGMIGKLYRFQKRYKPKIIVFYTPTICNKYIFKELRKNIQNTSFIKTNNFYNIALHYYSKFFKYDFSSLKIKNSYYINFRNSPIQKPELNTELAKTSLKKLNLNQNDKWVCIYNRDQNYLKKKFPNENFIHHTYRNFSINDFEKAIIYLISKGYKVIRVGSHPESKANFTHSNYIDYANSNYQNDFMDVLIMSNAQFCIFGCSGILDIPLMFDVPLLRLNYIPLYDIFKDKFKHSIIFKKYYDIKKKKILSIEEVFERNLHNLYYSEQYNDHEIRLIDNSTDEILSLVKEFESFDGREKLLNEDKDFYEKINLILERNKVKYFINPISKNFLSNIQILKQE